MALRGQHDKAYSLSNFPAHQNQSMISEKTRSKTVPYVSKPFPQDIQVCSGESRRLTVTDDFQSSRHGKRSTSLLSTQAAPMVRGHSTNRLLCHVRTTSEEILPEAIIKFPTKSNPCNTPPKTSDETLRKGISALPTNSKSSHVSPPHHYSTAVSPSQHYTTVVSPSQHYTTVVSPSQHYTTAVSPSQHYTTAVSPPLLSHQPAAVPPEGSTTAPNIPALRRGRLPRRESIQVGNHNDMYNIAQMTDFKDAKINRVVINNHYYHCNNSKSNGLHKYVKTESDRMTEVTNRHCSANGWDGSAATDGPRSGRRHLHDLDQDSCGPVKRHKADTSYTKSDCWQVPEINNHRIGVPASSTKGWDHNSLINDSVHSQIQRSCDSFVQHSSYEKHEVTSEGDRITLQKCSQSIICITDKVKIFDSDGEMVREGDVLYIDKEGGYYGVYIGDGRVTFVEVDGRVTTKTVNENLSIPIATEQMDTSAGYHGLQPRSRLETSRRAKDLIGQHYPGSGEDFTWLCRYNVPCVPK